MSAILRLTYSLMKNKPFGGYDNDIPATVMLHKLAGRRGICRYHGRRSSFKNARTLKKEKRSNFKKVKTVEPCESS